MHKTICYNQQFSKLITKEHKISILNVSDLKTKKNKISKLNKKILIFLANKNSKAISPAIRIQRIEYNKMESL